MVGYTTKQMKHGRSCDIRIWCHFQPRVHHIGMSHSLPCITCTMLHLDTWQRQITACNKIVTTSGASPRSTVLDFRNNMNGLLPSAFGFPRSLINCNTTQSMINCTVVSQLNENTRDGQQLVYQRIRQALSTARFRHTGSLVITRSHVTCRRRRSFFCSLFLRAASVNVAFSASVILASRFSLATPHAAFSSWNFAR